MAAQIIPFPQLESANGGVHLLAESCEPKSCCNVRPENGLHLVRSSYVGSQRTALRIVEDVCLEHGLPHPAFEEERAPHFWAKLPMPPSRVETPFSVAKRIAHLILPSVELA